MEISDKTRQAIAAANAKDIDSRRHMHTAMFAGIVVVLVVGMGLGAWLIFKKPSPPRLNADTATIAKFVETDIYLGLPLERQEQYMKILKDKEDSQDLQNTFSAGRITEDEFRAAKQEAWYWQQIKRSEHWAALPTPEKKVEYLNGLIEKKEKESHPNAVLPDVPKPDKSAPKLDKAPKAGGGVKKTKSAAPKPDEALGLKRDDAYERIRITHWPTDVRDRWNGFHRAYKDQKKVYEAALARAQVPPATRPSSAASN